MNALHTVRQLVLAALVAATLCCSLAPAASAADTRDMSAYSVCEKGPSNGEETHG